MSEEVPRDPGASHADAAASTEPSGGEPNDDALDAAITRLTEVVDGLQQLLDIKVARTRVHVREKAFRALGWLAFSVLLLALTGAAGLYVMRGLSGLLAGVLWNVSWAGDLAAGAAGLMLALATGIFLRSRLRHRNLRRIRDKFQRSAAPDPEAE